MKSKLPILAALLFSTCMAWAGTPAYVWRHVEIVAGGLCPASNSAPRKRNLLYARTDMGGAYRWNTDEKQWMPLTDWAGREDWNRLGIESIAPDPSEANRVYIASGTYMQPFAGNGVVLRSSDRGNTWQRTEMPFRMGGNENGRSIGERLAVDPHQDSILYLGSRHDGLWISHDFGATWGKSTSFPSRANPMATASASFSSIRAAAQRGNPRP